MAGSAFLLAFLALTASAVRATEKSETSNHSDQGTNERLLRLELLANAFQEEKEQWVKEKNEWLQEKQAWQEEKQQWDEDRRGWESERKKWKEEKEHWEKLLAITQSSMDVLKERVTMLESQSSPCFSSASKAQEFEIVGEHGDVLTQDSTKRSHVITERADDTNALEPVVNQISQKVNQLDSEIQAVKNMVSAQDRTIQDARYSTYVRWGHSTCASQADLVYTGVAGGGPYSDTRASVTRLCLPLNPVLSDWTMPDYFTTLYGGEYQTYNVNPHHDKDVLCSVCRIPRTTTIMKPATNVCDPGWTLEYSGFLMGGYTNEAAASEFACVDSQMEDRIASEKSEDGTLFFYTKTVCGSLPCPPYENGKIVTCAVCSK